ncbi:MAG: ABC transporter substrate-binding protein [Alphaproteobacteria bacterium]|nr:ABC transporter substrate-binding protein [Alphaproteobacteria bacterium]
MPMNSRPWIVLAGAAALAVAATAEAAEYGPGASDTEIKIGHTNPYSGRASAYGTIGKVISAYFDKVNDEGGINGRKITFISLDDGYNPAKTVEQVRKLVEQEEVLLLFQNLGTPTNSAVHKYVDGKQVPHLFLATGATKWADPDNFPWTMGWQPNYQSEARIYAQYILDNVEDPKIGVLYQNDDYGKDYLTGLRDGLGDRADELIVLTVPYETSDPTIDSQIVQLKESGANVLLNVATPKWAAQAIKKAHDIGWQPVHLLNNVSTSVPAVLAPAGLDKSTGIVSSAYYKSPGDPTWADDPDFQDWVAFMNTYYPDGNTGSGLNVYGYAVAKTLEHVLRQAGDELTRENIMEQAASMSDLEIPMLLPGIVINTNSDDFKPLEQMRLQRFNGERWELFGPVMEGAPGS